MTITRVVIAQPKSSLSKEDLDKELEYYKAEWAKMEFVENVTAGVDHGNRNQGYSLFGILTFKDKEALGKYEEAIRPEILPRLRKTTDDLIVVMA